MYFSGFADEAGAALSVQIAATQELGWRHIEMRNVKVEGAETAGTDFAEGALSAVAGANIHDIPDAAFERLVAVLEKANVRINCFGSALANGAKSVEAPFETEWQEAKRAAKRMQRLGTKLIRVMSYRALPGADQMAAERFRRLREMNKLFSDIGAQMVHENCAGYGGNSARNTLEMLDAVPGLKLVFDTGNPTREADMSQPPNEAGERPRQSSWEFYSQVKPHVAYVHIKDGVYDPATKTHRWVLAGDGQGDVRRIVADLLVCGYDGGLSIEPHLPVERYPDLEPSQARQQNYLDYGRRAIQLVDEIKR